MASHKNTEEQAGSLHLPQDMQQRLNEIRVALQGLGPARSANRSARRLLVTEKIDVLMDHYWPASPPRL